MLVTVWTRLKVSPTSPAPARRDTADQTDSPARTAAEWTLPPPLASRFENTRADVAYVGSSVCAECHSEAHASYLETAHSRALADVDAEQEPLAAEFYHAASGRRYEVKRQGDQLWHSEWASDGQGEEFLLASHAMHFRIGSGHHSRSYLAELDGFLVESPVTWYASKQRWNMSPGYDAPRHPGFERLADLGCLQCHAGRVEPIKTRFRVRIHESSIGCENCHGPGALHVERRRSNPDSIPGSPATADLTIVNPDRLTRDQREAICAQCHLRSAATILVRGRSLAEFRPGLRLEDFRVDYAREHSGTAMTVVGHIEQMRSSKCYQGSETFTCTTCHDPHAKAEESEPAYFRAKCLECHADCGLEAAVRLERDATDNCVNCHMPKSETDIPHFAFTHHRIAIPSDAAIDTAAADAGFARLIPASDISHLPTWEQQRCLALAYLEFSEDKPQADWSRYRAQSLHLLETLNRRGIDDIEVNAALARLDWVQGRLQEAVPLAQRAAGAQSDSGSVANALLVLADSYLRLNQPAPARDALVRLVSLRRQAESWLMLASCLRSLGEPQEAIRACQKAIEIQPGRVDARLMLADLYAAIGDTDEAARCRDGAKTLERLMPPPP